MMPPEKKFYLLGLSNSLFFLLGGIALLAIYGASFIAFAALVFSALGFIASTGGYRTIKRMRATRQNARDR